MGASKRALVAGELVIEAQSTEQSLQLDWTGRSNARDPWSDVRAYFEDVAETLASDGRHLEMRFERIEYFNSSTITAVIRIMQLLQSKSIGLNIVYDPNLRWQKLSFDGLKIFEQSNKLLQIREA